MAIIPDASAILSLAYDDEDTDYGHSLLDAIAENHAVVPTLFWFEVRNALLMGERRGRIAAEQTATFLVDLEILPFEVDDQPNESAVMALARQHTLTVYDAAYLELAQRRGASIATIDRALIRAAIATGVTIWSPAT